MGSKATNTIKRVVWSLVGIFALALGLHLSIERPYFEKEHGLQTLGRHITEREQVRDGLLALQERRAGLQQQSVQYQQAIELKKDDLSFSREGAQKRIKQLAPNAKLDTLPTGFLLSAGKTAFSDILPALAKDLPLLQLQSLSYEDERYWTMSLQLRQTTVTPEEVHLEVVDLTGPLFPSARGESLRKKAAALDQQIAHLKKALGPLRFIEQRQQALQQTTGQNHLGDRLTAASQLVIHLITAFPDQKLSLLCDQNHCTLRVKPDEQQEMRRLLERAVVSAKEAPFGQSWVLLERRRAPSFMGQDTLHIVFYYLGANSL